MIRKPEFVPIRPLAARAVLAVAALAGLAITPPAGAQGSFVGVTAVRAQLFTTPEQQGFSPSGLDHFGASVAAGDFNGDGADDLVTGLPFVDCAMGRLDCGAVFVRWSAPGSGLTVQGGYFWPDVTGLADPYINWSRYGTAVAAGDFDGNGADDLVVGVPGSLFSDYTGLAQVFYGQLGGMETVPSEVLQPGVAGLPAPENPDFRDWRFGAAFAVGDFDGDGVDDLATGAPNRARTNPERFSVGGVVVAHGQVAPPGPGGGLLPFHGYLVAQDEGQIPDTEEQGDRFGAALAAGDFNGDGFDDLAIGVPGEDDRGAVLVLFANGSGLSFVDHYFLRESDLGVTGSSGDAFGAALAAGDFDGDGYDDLAIGAPGQDSFDGTRDEIGIVVVLYGSDGSPQHGGGGFAFGSTQWWWGDAIGTSSVAGERFGSALAAGDFDGDGFADLAIGAPLDLDGGRGELSVLAGRPEGLAQRIHLFRLGAEGVPTTGPPQTGQHFAAALAAGDFDGNGFADLAVGVPGLDFESVDAGGEVVFYGALFADGFESGNRSAWSSSTNGAPR